MSMPRDRIPDYLLHMRNAANKARAFVEGYGKKDFLDDERTRYAVIMSLVILGEAAAQIIRSHPDFVFRHPYLPWHGMRGMRNYIVHDCFSLDFDVVWDTVQTNLPELLDVLPRAIDDARDCR